MDENGKALNTAQGEGEKFPTERTCRICGCTDSKACEGGCGWVIMFGKQTEICTKCFTDEVPECIDLLIATILQTHQNEIDQGLLQHQGEGGCIMCDLIKTARNIEAALRQ